MKGSKYRMKMKGTKYLMKMKTKNIFISLENHEQIQWF